MPRPASPLRPTVRQLPRLAAPTRPLPSPTGHGERGGPHSFAWTFAITALGLFMFALDRLIVTNALPVIERDLGAGVGALEWTINAFTLTFAVLLLSGAALGDRFGRRRVFTFGLGLFTLGSAAAALAPSAPALIAARAVQGAGGAIITPLSLTLLLGATPAHKRGAVLGAWGSIAGIAAASGPVLGGALTGALSWHWIFGLNVPIGLALIPLARAKLQESHGPNPRLDLPGLALSATGLLALVWALVEAGNVGWHSPSVIGALAAGAATLVAFASWEQRAPAPMLPLSFFRVPTFAAASATTLVAYSGLFGALFMLGQLLQSGFGHDPLHAGLGLVPMTGAMVFTAPAAGALSDRVGPRPVLCGALVLEALALLWVAAHARSGVSYALLAPGLMAAGIGAATLFAPIQAALVAAVAPERHGQASGAAITIREVGGVLGVAIIAGVFTAHGATTSPDAFLAGARPALLVAALTVATATLGALALPRRRPAQRTGAPPAAVPAPQPATG
jgi:EmrB/QacA subfamily drug resistance transporter